MEQFNESQVPSIIGAKNFREVSKDKIMQLASMIPMMDQRTAAKVIEQFPEYANLANRTAEQINQTSRETIHANNNSVQRYYDVGEQYVSACIEASKSEDYRRECLKNAKNMIDDMRKKDAENKDWLGKVIATVASVLGVSVVVAAALLGVNVDIKGLFKKSGS